MSALIDTLSAPSLPALITELSNCGRGLWAHRVDQVHAIRAPDGTWTASVLYDRQDPAAAKVAAA